MAKSRSALKLNSPVIKIAAVAGAYFLAADFVNSKLDSLALSKIMPPAAPATGVSKTANWVGVGAEGIGGYMLLMKGRTSILKLVAGSVLTAAALKRALKTTGVITGYQSVPVIGSYQSVPVIGKNSGPAWPGGSSGYRVNGADGYRVNGRGSSAVMGSCDNGTTEGSTLIGG